MKKSNIFNNAFQKIVVIVTVVVVIIYIYKDVVKKNKIIKHHEFSIGKITKYHSSGSPESFHLRYSYTIDKQQFYERSIHAPFEKFPGCEHDFSICSDKRFWVAHEKDDPSNSLINIDIEIQDIENPKPPKNLDGFR